MPADTKKHAKIGNSDKATIFHCPPGIPDVLPDEDGLRHAVEEAGELIATLHDFRRIDPPLIEFASVFEAGLGVSGLDGGESSLYLVKAKRGLLALRPDAAIGVMRAHLEHRLGHLASPLKVWTEGPQFRSRSPKSRVPNLSHEISYHLIGDSDAVYDVEAILSTLEFLRELRFKDLKLFINTLGCRVCRPNYREKLKAYYRARKEKLCRECALVSEKNPMRCFACTDAECLALRADAPIVLDYLCQNCNNHFKTVLELVEDNTITYEPNPYLVPDIDYYNRTIFEVVTEAVPPVPPGREHGVQAVPWKSEPLAVGGRYDYLAELLRGRMVPAVMGTIRVDAVVSALRAFAVAPAVKQRPHKVFFIAVGEQAKKSSVRLMAELRAGGITVAEALGKKSLKAQLKIAERVRVPQVLLVGQKEAFEGTVIIRDMRTGAQETLLANRFVDEVKRRLK